MKEDHLHAYHGGQWAEHEDYLIGNRKGLEVLRSAIYEALENGESGIASGEFLEVKCLESEFFEQPYKENTIGSYIGFALIVIAFIVTVFIVWLSKTI